jgi:hypothetical protein
MLMIGERKHCKTIFAGRQDRTPRHTYSVSSRYFVPLMPARICSALYICSSQNRWVDGVSQAVISSGALTVSSWRRS